MTQRDRLMVSTLVLVVLVAGYWFLLLAPKRQAADDAAARVETARQGMTTAQQQLSNGQNAQKLFRQQRSTVVRLGRVVPTTDDTATLLTQLTGIAKKHDIVFTSYALNAGATAAGPASGTGPAPAQPSGTGTNTLTDAVSPLYPPGTSQTDGGLGRAGMQIKLAGRYFDLERFLREVQRFAVLSADGKAKRAKGRLFVVDGISYQPMAAGDGGAPADAITAELQASVYFAPPLEIPSAVPGADGGGAPPATAPASSETATIGGLQ